MDTCVWDGPQRFLRVFLQGSCSAGANWHSCLAVVPLVLWHFDRETRVLLPSLHTAGWGRSRYLVTRYILTNGFTLWVWEHPEAGWQHHSLSSHLSLNALFPYLNPRKAGFTWQIGHGPAVASVYNKLLYILQTACLTQANQFYPSTVNVILSTLPILVSCEKCLPHL